MLPNLGRQLGPVSINMFADSHMAHYTGGVLAYSNCSEGTNHGVLAVGYGTCHPGNSSGPCANVSKVRLLRAEWEWYL